MRRGATAPTWRSPSWSRSVSVASWLAGLSASLPPAVARAHLVTANALFPTAGTIASAAATVVGLLGMRPLGADAPTRLVVAVAAGMAIAGLVSEQDPAAGSWPGGAGQAEVGRP